MDISKNSVYLFFIGQILVLIVFIFDLFYFQVLDTIGYVTIEGVFLAIVIMGLFIKSYIQTDQSYFNGKKENQRKYD